MERPSRADHGVKPSTIWLHIHKKAKRAIDGDCQNAVERKKIRRQRDPKVGLVGNYMPTVTANAKSAHASTHQTNPERVGQFVSEDVNEDRTWKTEKRDQPQNCAQGKKPKFFGRPKALRDGRARESGKKCLTENCADRQKENRKNEFHPTRRNGERIRYRNKCSRTSDVADNPPAALGIALSAIVSRSSLSCSQSCRRLRRAMRTKARLNR